MLYGLTARLFRPFLVVNVPFAIAGATSGANWHSPEVP
jgi:hypothetical protein